MTLQMGLIKKLDIRKDKVKCVDLHPSEPWVASGLYSGGCTIYNYEKQTLVKKLELGNSAVRCCKFIARKQWLIAGGDEMCILVYNYNSLERVTTVEGHTDYIRYLDVHPTLPYVLSCSDDMTVCLWDFERNWERICVFEGHQHYVMMVKWSPKDVSSFATCSLDHTIKFWGISQDMIDRRPVGLSSPKPFFSLKGHTRGVNCIGFSSIMSNPYIISGSDDATVRVWDYQTKLCLQVLSHHTQAVTSVLHHPRLPLIVTAGEDGEINLWHCTLYKVKRTVNLSVGKVWSIASNMTDMAIGSDVGTSVVQFGGERPLVSMHMNKLVMVKMFDIVNCNLSSAVEVDEEYDGKPLTLEFRNIGSCEFVPQSVSHHPNGRFICLCGDSEYVIYTSQGMRSKTFGKANQVVWSLDGHYATWDGAVITIHEDFTPTNTVRSDVPVLSLHGGRLLGVTSVSAIQFYDWNTGYLVRTIDAHVENVWWNNAATKVALGCLGNCYILKFNNDTLHSAMESQEYDNTKEVSSTFVLEGEISERVSSATWAMDTFVYITAGLHLCLWTASSSEIFQYLDRPLHMIGYSPQNGKLYLCHDDVIAFSLPSEYLAFHSMLASKMDAATHGGEFVHQKELEKLVNGFAPCLKERASKFLESVGDYNTALLSASAPERQFELYLRLGNVEECLHILKELEGMQLDKSRDDALRGMWRRLSTYCLEEGRYDTAVDCLAKCNDYASSMLLHVVMGNREGIREIAELAMQGGESNVAFSCYYVLNDIQKCIEILQNGNRHSEAAIMSRTFKPSLIKDSFDLWVKNRASKTTVLEDPVVDPAALELEEILDKRLKLVGFPPATEYPKLKDSVQTVLKDNDGSLDKESLASDWTAGL